MDYRAVVAFLTARLAEDKEVAGKAEGSPSYLGPLWTVSAASAFGRDLGPRGSVEASPCRTLAEVDAKRQVIDRCMFYLDNHRTGDCSGEWLAEDVLVMLAQAYAWHHDFDPEWLP